MARKKTAKHSTAAERKVLALFDKAIAKLTPPKGKGKCGPCIGQGDRKYELSALLFTGSEARLGWASTPASAKAKAKKEIKKHPGKFAEIMIYRHYPNGDTGKEASVYP